MSPRTLQKDKKEWDPPPNVLLRRSKRQKGSVQWSKCPIEAFKKTKGNDSHPEMSPRSRQKDKKGEGSESKCLFKTFKKTKRIWAVVRVSFRTFKKTKGNKFPGKASFMVKGK